MKANRTWTRTAAGGTGLAADAVPGALDTDDDNVTTISPPRTAPIIPLRGVALFYDGPTATLDVALHIWEETAEAFLEVATATLTASEITRVAIPAALDHVTAKAWQTVHVLVTLDGDAGATNGAHDFYLWADLGP
jgi:hypothetical protein